MKYKINDIIKHKTAYYYYIISSMDKNNVVLYRVYHKNNKWNIDYKTDEFNSINTIIPILNKTFDSNSIIYNKSYIASSILIPLT